MESQHFGPYILDRMVQAAEKQQARLARSTAALGEARVPYAVIGDNAVAAWVTTVDPSAVRFTPEVVIAVRREDLVVADAAIRAANFLRIRAERLDLFFDERWPADIPMTLLVRKAVRLATEDQPERFDDGSIYQLVANSIELGDTKVASLADLVPAELTANRTLNKLRVRDLIDVDLVDATWCDRLPPLLADRLCKLLADPEG